jgi:hypothetical protein
MWLIRLAARKWRDVALNDTAMALFHLINILFITIQATDSLSSDLSTLRASLDMKFYFLDRAFSSDVEGLINKMHN